MRKPVKGYIGIDPGATGAIAFFVASGRLFSVHDLPNRTDGKGRHIDVCALRRLITTQLREMNITAWAESPVLVCVEDAWVYSTDGRSSAASFVRSISEIHSVLDLMSLDWCMVRPQTWKAHFNLTHEKAPNSMASDDRKLFSRRAKALAKDNARKLVSSKWPFIAGMMTRKKDADRAEACLIGLWVIENGIAEERTG